MQVWLVMELCSCGTLREAYSRPRDTMAMARLVSRLLEVAKGMAFLHANNLLHGELHVLCISLLYEPRH
jgi:serine/threonine protein kinase